MRVLMLALKEVRPAAPRRPHRWAQWLGTAWSWRQDSSTLRARAPMPQTCVDVAWRLTTRLSDAGTRRQTKMLYLDHRSPPCPTEDATPRSLEPIVRGRSEWRRPSSRAGLRIPTQGPVRPDRQVDSSWLAAELQQCRISVNAAGTVGSDQQ